MRILSTLAGLFLTFLLFMTGARFVLLLLNANKDNEIVHWILSRSDYWVKPFVDVFHLTNKVVGDTGGVFEPVSLIAFIVYAIVGSIILAALNGALFGGFGGRRILHEA
jgi:uncharacterized membrane protein YdjX (TVP38/TMEM64 family)